jgi:hypothetical protein
LEGAVDFSFQRLRPNERIVWSPALEKAAHDATIRPAPSLAEESRPRMCQRDQCADVGAFKVSDERVIRSLRKKWGIGP